MKLDRQLFKDLMYVALICAVVEALKGDWGWALFFWLYAAIWYSVQKNGKKSGR